MGNVHGVSPETGQGGRDEAVGYESLAAPERNR